MKPLIDGDVLRYEIGSCGEYKDEEGEHRIRDWEFVQELLDNRIDGICYDMQADEPPVIFLTGNTHSTAVINRGKAFAQEDLIELKTPIRDSIATIKPYKGTRKEEKPFHFNNITAYFLSAYETVISNDGLEADDLMAMAQSENTVICTRDKDLRMVPGLHFGWECGKQPSFGPELVDRKGWLKKDKKGNVKGVGLKFFFYQMLVGDGVDNIPGCPGIGPVKAFNMLDGLDTKKDFENAVRASYKAVYGDNYKQYLEENSKLLWMIRELDKDGNPIYYDWKH